MKIDVIKKIEEGDPDYHGIGEPFYYIVKINDPSKKISGYEININNEYEYYPPDPNDREDNVKLGVIPALYGRFGIGNERYYDILKKVHKITKGWSIKKILNPSTVKAFEELIDEL